MKKRNVLIFPKICLIAFTLGLATHTFATGTYDGGDGSINNPFEISTALHLDELGQHPEDCNLCFVLTNDINLSGFSGTSFHRIGYFTGCFDGNEHTISNFSWSSTGINYVGLFSRIGGSGKVMDLKLEGINVIAYGSSGLMSMNTGGLVGENFGTITNCSVAGSVSGEKGVGGIAGQNSGTIILCHSTGNVTRNDRSFNGPSQIGGLVGYNVGEIDLCYANCQVKGRYMVGGLVGEIASGTISRSYSMGSVTGSRHDDKGNYTGEWVGGLIGNIYQGQISFCYSTANVTGGDLKVGGLVGLNEFGTITSCYSRGNVSGNYNVGGLVGNCNSQITHCYSTGVVTGNTYVGGLVGGMGSISGSADNCFWDKITSGQTSGAGDGSYSGITGKTTNEMKMQTTFTLAGWDFLNKVGNDSNYIWRMCVDGIDYPKLSWQYTEGDILCPDGVEFFDFSAFVSSWMSAEGQANWNAAFDFIEDGEINIQDIATFCGNWLTGIE